MESDFCYNYYPFGLQHATSWTRSTTLKNNRLYNAGSEFNEQTKNYETFYRQYDPAIGRFTSIDPLATKYTSTTPYNYAFNDLIALNDPLGDDPANCIVCNRTNYSTTLERMRAGDSDLASRGQRLNSYGGITGEQYDQMYNDGRNLSAYDYAQKYGIQTGSGLYGLIGAYGTLNPYEYSAGTFQYTSGGKTYGGQYHTTNGMVTSTATSQIILDNSSGGWMGIGETTISDYEAINEGGGNSGADWNEIGDGIIVTTGGLISTVFGVAGVLSGVGVAPGAVGIVAGGPVIGFGITKIIDGAKGGSKKDKIPGGLIEAVDRGLGGTVVLARWEMFF